MLRWCIANAQKCSWYKLEREVMRQPPRNFQRLVEAALRLSLEGQRDGRDQGEREVEP